MVERPMRTGTEYRARLSPKERSKLERWEVKTISKVVHHTRGTVVVPHRSNLAALMNAAEVWGCDWTEIRDAEVWAADPGAVPVPMFGTFGWIGALPPWTSVVLRKTPA